MSCIFGQILRDSCSQVEVDQFIKAETRTSTNTYKQ